METTAAPPRGGFQAAVRSLVQNTPEMHHWQLYNKQLKCGQPWKRSADIELLHMDSTPNVRNVPQKSEKLHPPLPLWEACRCGTPSSTLSPWKRQKVDDRSWVAAWNAVAQRNAQKTANPRSLLHQQHLHPPFRNAQTALCAQTAGPEVQGVLCGRQTTPQQQRPPVCSTCTVPRGFKLMWTKLQASPSLKTRSFYPTTTQQIWFLNKNKSVSREFYAKSTSLAFPGFLRQLCAEMRHGARRLRQWGSCWSAATLQETRIRPGTTYFRNNPKVPHQSSFQWLQEKWKTVCSKNL